MSGSKAKPWGPLDLVGARPWRATAFTTYSLSLSFFETVILDQLVRAHAKAPHIFADVEGVRAGLSEQGARRVGREYGLEPVENSHGAFHAKLSVLIGETDAHVFVGSGNLTFGGWGANLEVLEHLHTSFAADAIADTADFFAEAATAPRLRHGAAQALGEIAELLSDRARNGTPNGDVRVIHNLKQSITDQIQALVSDLGGAQRLVAASPYWDEGGAIDRLCDALGLDGASVHVPTGGSVGGGVGFNWPPKPKRHISAVEVEFLDDPKRQLHAKAFEIVCKDGRLVVSGSANATHAALGFGGNVETCVARIVRGASKSWSIVPASAPAPHVVGAGDKDDEGPPLGVIRAVLENGYLNGEVLTSKPKLAGKAAIFLLAEEGPEHLDDVELGADQRFRIRAGKLERLSWQGARLVLRVKAQSGAAEGFVAVAAFTEIARRAGVHAPRLFAFLAGTETPEDVAAMMAWFQEDPSRIDSPLEAISSGGASDGKETKDVLVPVNELTPAFAEKPHASASEGGSGHVPGWARFLEQLHAAFRERRGRIAMPSSDDLDEGDDEGSNSRPNSGEAEAYEPGVAKALKSFMSLFALMTSPGRPPAFAVRAFDLAGYICERLNPSPMLARMWLKESVDALLRAGAPAERKRELEAAILILLDSAAEEGAAARARGRLRRIEADLAGEPPATVAGQGFLSVLDLQSSLGALWQRVRDARTNAELAYAYWRATLGENSQENFEPWLTRAQERATLQAALLDGSVRARIFFETTLVTACPKCFLVLPRLQASRLRDERVASALNCCKRVIVCTAEI